MAQVGVKELLRGLELERWYLPATVKNLEWLMKYYDINEDEFGDADVCSEYTDTMLKGFKLYLDKVDGDEEFSIHIVKEFILTWREVSLPIKVIDPRSLK